MAEGSISRKNLLPQLKRIDKDDWLYAAERLGLRITQPSSGTSHAAIRNTIYNASDIRSLIATVYSRMNKIPSVNQKVFKRFLKHGISEDDLWRALNILQ
jgi:hypothetical protein